MKPSKPKKKLKNRKEWVESSKYNIWAPGSSWVSDPHFGFSGCMCISNSLPTFFLLNQFKMDFDDWKLRVLITIHTLSSSTSVSSVNIYTNIMKCTACHFVVYLFNFIWTLNVFVLGLFHLPIMKPDRQEMNNSLHHRCLVTALVSSTEECMLRTLWECVLNEWVREEQVQRL